MAGRKSRYQLVLSVLLLPVGGGEDDIDIGAGVLGLGGGGVQGAWPRRRCCGPLVILARVPIVIMFYTHSVESINVRSTQQ